MTPTVNEDDRVELVARALCRAHDAIQRNTPDRGALLAYQAGSNAVVYWDDLARAAIASLQGADTVTETEAAYREGWSNGWFRGEAGVPMDRVADDWEISGSREIAMRTAAPTAQDEHPIARMVKSDEEMGLYDNEPLSALSSNLTAAQSPIGQRTVTQSITPAQDDTGARLDAVWDELQSLLPQSGVGAELQSAWDRLQSLLAGQNVGGTSAGR